MGMGDAKNPQAKEPYTILWPRVYYVIFQHCFSVYALICIYAGRELITGKPWRWQTLLIQAILVEYGMVSVQGGMHRLWAHRSWQAKLPVKLFLGLGATIQVSTSILMWGKMHRVHHKYSDTTADPHDARRGFWFSHIGWLLTTKHPDFLQRYKEEEVPDLEADPVVKFQAMIQPWGHYVCSYLLPTIGVAWMFDDSLIFGFVSSVLRYHVTAHRVFSINSVTHTFGWKPYSRKGPETTSTARDNPLGAMMGGGCWHNWHHTYCWDYADAELGALQQWNPTKVFIDTMALFGLAYNRKRALNAWEKKKRKYEEDTGKPFVEGLEGWPLLKVRTTCLGADVYGEEDPRLLGNEFNKESLKGKNAGMLEKPGEGKPKVQ